MSHRFDINIQPSSQGDKKVSLDFGILNAGESHSFEVHLHNTSKFHFVEIEATTEPELLKITSLPSSIFAGKTEVITLEIDVPADIVEPISPSLQIEGAFLIG